MPYKDKERQREFISSSSRTVTVRFVNSTDSEVIKWLDNQDHPSSAIKKVMRDHVEKEGN